jgi:hypothetical protein
LLVVVAEEITRHLLVIWLVVVVLVDLEQQADFQ